ncbi:helix-turn-helix domain-containing protein [Nocardia thailandica]|uniref:Helix-turn-helix domain-containing protein n=1 Tax=Nocardia thailandica TaxID=257275 RepID=A0ABW6PRM7_9NOCA|nr:helix-turn-helix domain-containing protein [Nocardia thailandica]
MTEFAPRLNKLFESTPGIRPHTNRHVARALREAGHSISAPYLSQLRTGLRTNPSRQTVAALAHYFQVEPEYFFGDIVNDPVPDDHTILTRLHLPHPRRLLLTVYGLSADSQELLIKISERLRASEGLPALPCDTLV